MSDLDSLPVLIRQKIDVQGDCMIWTGARREDGGRPRAWWKSRKVRGDRLVARLLALPDLPLNPGYKVRDGEPTCGNMSCVNPLHTIWTYASWK